jgi:Type I phosphodiesterase / nucleotide pyrophosphatase
MLLRVQFRADRIVIAVVAAAVFVLGITTLSTAATPPTRPAGPRLVVLFVLDQFRADYLDRFAPRFGPGGFARLEQGGARFEDCAYPYALTETSPGHATLATGTTPDRHGIVSNEWLDRATGRVVVSVEDTGAPLLGATPDQPGCSPRRLIGDTLADEMRLATLGRSKVFGLALKARAAILATGRSANGAFWFDEASGRMISSRYYGAALPAWVEEFNARRPADRFVGREIPGGGRLPGPVSPGGLPGGAYYVALQKTPFVHDLLFEFARETVRREGLGADDAPDFLFIGLSGHDYLGHEVGPYAPQVGVMAERADSQIADFLRFLDERVGAGRYLVALSADHGVGPTMAQGEAAGIAPRDLDALRLRRVMERALADRFDAADAIRRQDAPLAVWFDEALLERRHATPSEAARVAAGAAAAIDGVLGFVLPDGGTSVDRATTEAYRLSTYPGRSPDLFLVPLPFTSERKAAPANHGSPWGYDARVPLLFYGAAIRATVSREPCTPADVAPTLAAALRIPPPAMATGRVLERALR